MERSGFHHVLVNEFDRRACATLRCNRAVKVSDEAAALGATNRWPLIEGDVRGIDFIHWRGEVDVVAGGARPQ
jgi:DNA (cytosine-5)-methyltransferase 1